MSAAKADVEFPTHRAVLNRLKNYPFLLWFGAALVLLAVFIEFTDLFLGGHEPGRLDLFVLRAMADLRSPLLTTIFVNLTSLGSWTVITLHTAIAFALLLTTRDRVGGFQLAAASAGALALMELTKGFIGRPRPTAVPVLVEAFGFSYPSGHSVAASAMYVTIAILAFRHLSRFKQRVIVTIFTVIVIAGVGISRIYLGVHYATDAVSGVLLGTAWALIVAGCVAFMEYRRR